MAIGCLLPRDSMRVTYSTLASSAQHRPCVDAQAFDLNVSGATYIVRSGGGRR